MPNSDHDNEDRRHERGEDRIIALLQGMLAAQDRSSAQILAQLGAVQLDIKELGKADTAAALAQEKMQGKLDKATSDATEAKVLALQLKEQTDRWRGGLAVGLLVLACLQGIVFLWMKAALDEGGRARPAYVSPTGPVQPHP